MLKLESDIYQTLTATEKDVLHFILDNQEFSADATSREIAEKCNVSKTVVINLSKKIGFDGFNEYKYFLKDQLQKLTLVNKDLDFVKDTMNSLERTLLLNQTEELNRVVEKILAAETIYILGRGSSKFMAQYLTHQLMTLKIKAIVVSDFNHFDVIAQTMGQRDLMVALSLSGETKITVNTAKVAVMKQRDVISITAFSNNTLANLSQNNLYFVSSNTDTRVLDTVARTPMIFVLELLVNQVKIRIVDTNTHYDNHHISSFDLANSKD